MQRVAGRWGAGGDDAALRWRLTLPPAITVMVSHFLGSYLNAAAAAVASLFSGKVAPPSRPMFVMAHTVLAFLLLCAALACAQDTPFVTDRVVEVSLTISNSDWEAMKRDPLATEWYPADIVYDGVALSDVGVRTKGQSSLRHCLQVDSDRFSLKVKFNKYVSKQYLYGVSKLNFNNGFKDPSFVRESVAYAMIRQYGPGSRTAYANMTLNGEHMGLYVVVEQVDKYYIRDRFEYSKGDLYKLRMPNGNLWWMGDELSDYSNAELKTNEDDSDGAALISSLRSVNFGTTIENITAAWDLNNTLAYYATQIVLVNLDSGVGNGNNMYVYQQNEDSNEPFMTAIPWDLNEVFGVFTCGRSYTELTQMSIFESTCSSIDQFPMMKRIMPFSKKTYLALIEDMVSGPFQPVAIQEQIDSIVQMIEPYVAADPKKFYSMDDFLCEVSYHQNENNGGPPPRPPRAHEVPMFSRRQEPQNCQRNTISLSGFVEDRRDSILKQLQLQK